MQRDALFELLATSPAAIRVVTSNRRLARSLGAEFDRYQTVRGQMAWETPQILPFSAFVATLYDLAQHDPDLTSMPVPLTAAQERALWEAVVSDSELGMLASTAGATLAADAWALAHQWDVASRVRRYTAVADTRVFVNWAGEYHRRVDAVRAIDQARLPDIVREHVEASTIAAPPRVLLAGFDETTPQQQQLFDALVTRGTLCERFEPARHAVTPRRAACLDEQDENEKVADWVAARLAADPRARIGIVVPQLSARRRALAATLDAALLPDRLLAPAGARPYTVSLGGALSDVALIAFFLRSIRLVLDGAPFEEASAMLRSPYFTGAVVERDARDLIDAQLRQRCQRSVDIERILEAVQASARDCGVDVAQLLAGFRALSQWRRLHATRLRRPSEWASAFAQSLQSIISPAGGFAIGEAVDSNEYQALARWQELLGEFAALDRTVGRIAAAGAFGQLQRLAHETMFQPDGGAPPVQVLGVLEANDLVFDHVWIMGLTAEAWPPPLQPSALLPIELQSAVGMPGASASVELERSRRRLQRLLQSAPEVIVSHATVDVDRQIAPSPMIASFEEWVPPRRAARLIDGMTPAALTSTRDAVAPAWRAATPLRGGAAILQNQAACPFRAFAVHRLNARAIESPHDGFDYRERGQLVHDTLAGFWTALPEPTRDALAATPEQERRALLGAAASAAQLRLQRRRGTFSAALTELESARLVRLIEQWLQYEIETRTAFRVIATEDARTMQVGPLTVSGRLDRVDESADGSRIVIDYKTGGTKNPGWLEARPDEPQLPLYLTASEPAARAIALARVRTAGVGFTALAAEPDLLPGRFNLQWKGRHASWSAVVEHWSDVLERLAMQFAAGDAAVDPKRLPQTCRYCDLPTLCRINERGGMVTVGAPDDDDGTPWVRDDD